MGRLVIVEPVSDLVSVEEAAAEQHEARDEDAGAEEADQAGQQPAAWTGLARLDSGATSLLGLLAGPAVDDAVTEQVPPDTGPGPGLDAGSPPDVRAVAGPQDRSHHQPQTSPGRGGISPAQSEPDIHLMVLSLQVLPGGHRVLTTVAP